MKQLELITSQYHGLDVTFRPDGYLNATAIAKHFNKRPQHYLDSARTIEYIAALAKAGIPAFEKNQGVIVKSGTPATGGGTWFHPKLAIDFARWLNPDFAVWCDERIELILHGAAGKRADWEQALFDRMRLNRPPAGYFSVFSEAKEFALDLISNNVPHDPATIPDISFGICWGKYWTAKNLAQRFGERTKHPHLYPSWYPQSQAYIDAFVYPEAAVPEFRRWLREDYIANNLGPYLVRKVAKGDLAREEMLAIINAVQPKTLAAA